MNIAHASGSSPSWQPAMVISRLAGFQAGTSVSRVSAPLALVRGTYLEAVTAVLLKGPALGAVLPKTRLSSPAPAGIHRPAARPGSSPRLLGFHHWVVS